MVYHLNFKQKSRRYKTFSKRIENETIVYPKSQTDKGRPKGARSVSSVLKFKILDLLQAGKSHAYISEYYSISKIL